MSAWSTILIVDDEQNTRDGLKQFLSGLDYDVLTAFSAREAIQQFKGERPDIVLTDLKMPEMDGLTLLHQIKNIDPNSIVIILTAYGTVENAVQAMKAGAYYYLMKPINLDELELIVKKALSQRSLEAENKDLKQQLFQERFEAGKIIGTSVKIKELVALARRVAESDSTVLIQGESGTGKELIAHLIHAASPRAQQPFVAVHVAALPDTLISGELFGHEKGAFTGASERRIGRFERAHNGTLFLDEISEIPEATQVKLLRAIQSGEFERLGSTKTVRTNARLICATNKNLKEEVRAGRFREDLFYRINVILLKVPPLRERKADIKALVEYYLEFFAGRNRKKIESITPEALTLLQNYEWPGNVRELKNIMERIVVLSNARVINVSQIPDDLKGGVGPRGTSSGPSAAPPAATIQEMERNMIQKALAQVGNNKSLAAKKLGISRRTLYRKIEEYRISG